MGKPDPGGDGVTASSAIESGGGEKIGPVGRIEDAFGHPLQAGHISDLAKRCFNVTSTILPGSTRTSPDATELVGVGAGPDAVLL